MKFWGRNLTGKIIDLQSIFLGSSPNDSIGKLWRFIMAKRFMDEFDLQAEAEGNAVRKFVKQQPAKAVGKRIQKMRKSEERGYTIQENRVIKKYF